MSKKLGKAIRPNMGVYFVFLALFVGAAVFVEEYTLAVIEAVLSIALFVAFLLQQFLSLLDKVLSILLNVSLV